MIRILTVLCLAIVVSACSGGNNTPEKVLSKDEMTNILLDVYITEAKVANYTPRLPRDSAKIVFEVLKQDILEEYDVSDSVFRQNVQYYFRQPEVMDEIYSRVLDSLNLKVQRTGEKEQE
ncbi:MAG: DUF4296 domain-containing protein [Candidatus Cyclobacteriaceae bacterium M2_1C_046]